MSHRTLNFTDAVYEYLQAVSLREAAVLKELRDTTAKLPEYYMQISPEQGQFMALLVQLMHARKTLDIGVYTGYSALAVALALPTDGQVIACDTSAEWTQIAQQYWKKAQVANKIHLHLAPALETLDALIAQGESGSFDFVFIDADKGNYPFYFEKSLQLIRQGGLILFDNTLRKGLVADPSANDNTTIAIRNINNILHNDPRITISMLPIGDGLTLALKK